MEKNVGSVDLEELKKAREALNEERGIETDPTMYNNYNPDRKNEDDLVQEATSSESEGLTNLPEQDFQSMQETSDDSQENSEENNEFSEFNDLINSAIENSENENLTSDENNNNDVNLSNVSNENLETNDVHQEQVLENYDNSLKTTQNEASFDTISEKTSPKTNDEEKDFDVYDKFSAFEIKTQPDSSNESSRAEDISFETENAETNEDKIEESLQEVITNENQVSENFSNENEALSDNEEISENQEAVSENSNESLHEMNEDANDLSSIGTIDFDSIANENLNSTEETEETETTDADLTENEQGEPESLKNNTEQAENIEEQTEQIEETPEEIEQTESDESEIENYDNVINESQSEPIIELENEITGDSNSAEIHENQSNFNIEEKTDKISNDYNTEVIDDYKKLKELDKFLEKEEQEEPSKEEKEESEEQEESQEPVFEKENIEYADIEPIEFVDLIATDEFRNSDKLSYIFGKDENDKVYYGNLRDFYNIAIFGKETNSVVGLVHSIILSLMLKNDVSEFNFVVCDSKADSKFEVYNRSKYMYFNRIAKTNKEILDTLIEITKELEERYKILAETGVKSIEQYNIIAKNDNLKPLPYIITVFNNYSKSVQLTESDKINTCLYQLLKFGRSVGLYEIVVAGSSIDAAEINYNLPTRIAFLTDDEDISLQTLGEIGAERLPTSSDYLLSSIEKSDIMHLRVPNITKSEIEVLIDSIDE